jgi:shikimate kinase
MGAGKTAIGKRVAEHLAVPFVDIDHLIEQETGLTVSAIFEKEGEAHFRKLERETIARELAKPAHVMATGGGAFMNEGTRALIKAKGFSVWLRADYETLLERVSRKSTRPLLEKGDKAKILKDLMEKRYPVYAEADMVVDTTSGPHQIVVNQIIDAL